MTERKMSKIIDSSQWGTGIAVIAYAVWMIWWAATIDARVDQTEKWIEANKNMPSIIIQVETRFEALCEKLDNLSHQLEKYNAKMDKYLMPGNVR